MKILTFVDLTPAQIKTIEAFESLVVRATLIKPNVLATFTTFQAQDVKIAIDQNGVIESVELLETR